MCYASNINRKENMIEFNINDTLTKEEREKIEGDVKKIIDREGGLEEIKEKIEKKTDRLDGIETPSDLVH